MATSGQFPKTAGDIVYAADLNELRRIPQNSFGDYVLNKDQSGMHIKVTGSIKVPATGVTGLTAGDAVTVYNPGPSALSISVYLTPAILPTYFIAGTTTKPSTLAVNGLATFLCVETGDGSNPAKFIVTGGGVS
jgi:hypothetical protein